MSEQQGNEEIVRQEFKKQAAGFSQGSLSLNNERLLNWIKQRLPLAPHMNVLDVAAGTGILSRALAPEVQAVTSIDLSPDMIAENIKQNKTDHISNIEVHLGHAEQLPFNDESYDLVISRLAFHHFVHPDKVLHEMARVSRRTGSVCVVDMISPEAEELYRSYNHYERLRDPSHTYALKESQFQRLFNGAGLATNQIEIIEVPIHVDRWLELTKTDERIAAKIKKDILLELQGEHQTGLFPYIDEGIFMFRQKWIQIVSHRI